MSLCQYLVTRVLILLKVLILLRSFDVEIIDTGDPEDFKIHITYKKDIPEGEPFVFDEDVNIELLKDIAS